MDQVLQHFNTKLKIDNADIILLKEIPINFYVEEIMLLLAWKINAKEDFTGIN